MKSSYKAGKALNTLMIAARCPAWHWIYEFYSIRESNQKGTYYVAAVRKNMEDGKPIATDDETRQLAEQFYHMMKKGNIKADDDEEIPF
jgi:hypothetical protein